MANLYDEWEHTKITSLDKVIKLSVRMKNPHEIKIPEGIDQAYFYAQLGDEYIDYATMIFRTHTDKHQVPRLISNAKSCYKRALQNLPDFARGKYSRKSLELRLEYIKSNLLEMP